MTSVATARALRATGLAWAPARGDRFVIVDRGMDADVFVLSDMTIEAHEFPTGTVIGFNGTTEWALDSVAAEDALWLPTEGQLRAALGPAFVRLERRGGAWAVTTDREDGPATTTAPDAEEAYALALLAVRARTSRELLPVAAAALAARLRPLSAEDWGRRAPDGVRTVVAVVDGAVGGLGADAPSRWPAALAAVLAAWTGTGERAGALAAGGPAGPAAATPDQVAETGAEGVLVDLAVATWDVARATGGDDRLDPAVVARALAHVRTWPTSGPSRPPGAPVAAAPGRDDAQDELLALTGRHPR